MNKIIPFPVHLLRDSTPPPEKPPAPPAKMPQRPRPAQPERERELRDNAARYFAKELARSEAVLAQLRERGDGKRLIQALEEQVAYYKRELANVTPAETD